MRISEYFDLGRTQHELDFVDVDVDTDTPLFLSSQVLATRRDPWSQEAHRILHSFFQRVVDLIIQDRHQEARELFTHLGEPNETCLGYSRGEPRGRGIGVIQSGIIFDAILDSQAVQTGVVEDLEDFRLFVHGIGRDKISDMTTNIVRLQLLGYTKAQADLWELPLRPDVPTGFYWNRQRLDWEQSRMHRLIVADRPLLLVPKAVVGYAKEYAPEKYHQHFVLNFLREEHLRLGTPLVRTRTLKSGAVRREVYKKDLKETVAPLTKEFLLEFTLRHRAVFESFRESTAQGMRSLSSLEIAEAVAQYDTPREWGERFRQLQPADVARHLVEELQATRPGQEQATEFHRLAAAILEFICYPRLTCPQVEQEIHEGRKRIDIAFDNSAETGFFFRLHTTHDIPCLFVAVECKNYRTDPSNPDLDQLSGRFSLHRGRLGLLVTRSVDDMPRLLRRCADTYRDGRGVIIPLEDRDLIALLDAIAERREEMPGEELLQARFRAIVQT